MQIWTRKTQSGKDSGGGREERQWRMRELGGADLWEEIWDLEMEQERMRAEEPVKGVIHSETKYSFIFKD